MKITKEQIHKLIEESKIEQAENDIRFKHNSTAKTKDIMPLQNKAFLKSIDAVMEYLK